MTQEATRYLRIHFAPKTACIDVGITEYQYNELVEAIGKHDGEVTLEVSSHHKIYTKKSQKQP
jgi:hypothetical protein